ncbi:MAG TPA: hypothetical protein DCW90_05360 [Lachnospiraceae bacterium]|nr:hypothetical protein [Lachnospiraceae bacterium]
MNTFLKVPTEYFSLIGEHKTEKGIIKIDYITILILAKIAEWENSDKPCAMQNDQIADFFHCSPSTVKRHLKKLCDLGVVQAQVTKLIFPNGFASRRILKTTCVEKYTKRQPA